MGLVGPAGMPRELVERIAGDLHHYVRERLDSAPPAGRSTDLATEYPANLARYVDELKALIEKYGLSPEDLGEVLAALQREER